MRPEANEGMNETFNERYITHLLELTESFIRYMISMSGETDKNTTKQNEDSKSSSSENEKN